MQFTRLGCRRELPLWRCRSRGGDAFALHIETGQMTPGPSLEKLVILRGGSVQREVDYEGGTGGVLQIVLSQSQSGSASSGVLMERRVFESIWNQLYMLGRPDERYFEPVLNRFPIARLYRVRSCDEHTPATCE